IGMDYELLDLFQNLNSDNSDGISYRNVISRSYYAMYHAARACVYYAKKVDEEDHIKLAKKVYVVLGKECESIFTNLRPIRNIVEYYPYVKENLAESAENSLIDCNIFLKA
ncbi:MAG: hypothetical protein ACE5J3_06145, partial [Methanosarcinales archaeon]